MRLLALVLLSACDPDPVAATDGGIDLAQARSFNFDDGGVTAIDLAMPALPEHCPCPLGSYCDLATNSCKRGCLGDDHCPMGQACDTTVYSCVLVCKVDQDCPSHLKCDYLGGAKVCKGCVSEWDDCNHDSNDGCETPLNTLTDCGKCGKPASTMCYLDMDGDRYSVPGSGIIECSCSNGRVYFTMGDDCDDTDYDVHPGQAQFFTVPRKSGGFDYDCDGVETRFYDFSVSNHCIGCTGNWWVSSAPVCGAMATHLQCDYDTITDMCVQFNPDTLQEKCR